MGQMNKLLGTNRICRKFAAVLSPNFFQPTTPFVSRQFHAALIKPVSSKLFYK